MLAEPDAKEARVHRGCRRSEWEVARVTGPTRVRAIHGESAMELPAAQMER